MFSISAYQKSKRFVGGQPRCRYVPSCSAYTSEAIDRFGWAKGAWFGMKRILRCHPWGSSGLDEIPGKQEGN